MNPARKGRSKWIDISPLKQSNMVPMFNMQGRWRKLRNAPLREIVECRFVLRNGVCRSDEYTCVMAVVHILLFYDAKSPCRKHKYTHNSTRDTCQIHWFSPWDLWEKVTVSSGLMKYISTVNTLRPRQDGRYFADDVLKCIFLNEHVWIRLKIPLKFVPRGPINNIPALVQIGLAPTRRQAIIWTNVGICTDAYMRHSASMS